VAVDVLRQLGATPEKLEERITHIVSEVPTQAGTKQASTTPTIDQLGTDLTALAEAGNLIPVIGRRLEIERVIQILARRTKNNPALIGEPGVGKTAIVEGLAQRIVAVRCLSLCWTSGCCSSTSAAWWPARCTADSSKNG